MATSDTSKDSNNNNKQEDSILSFGDSSSKKNDDIIKTDILGFPVKLDALTAGVGVIALLGLGIGGYQLWQGIQKSNDEEARRKQVEQQKQARYMQYLRNQELLIKQQEAARADLIEKQRRDAAPPQQSSYNNVNSGSGHYTNDIGYDTGIHSGLSGLDLEGSIDPYHKSSRFTTSNYNTGNINNNIPPRLSAYHQSYAPLPPAAQAQSQHHQIQPQYSSQNIEGSEDILPIEFSNPITNEQPPQMPNQQNKRNEQMEVEGEEQEQREEDGGNGVGGGSYEEGLSPDELMSSINNSSYYN